MTKFHLHKNVPGAGIIRYAGIIQGRALYEEIQYGINISCSCPVSLTDLSWGPSFVLFKAGKHKEINRHILD